MDGRGNCLIYGHEEPIAVDDADDTHNDSPDVGGDAVVFPPPYGLQRTLTSGRKIEVEESESTALTETALESIASSVNRMKLDAQMIRDRACAVVDVPIILQQAEAVVNRLHAATAMRQPEKRDRIRRDCRDTVLELQKGAIGLVGLTEEDWNCLRRVNEIVGEWDKTAPDTEKPRTVEMRAKEQATASPLGAILSR